MKFNAYVLGERQFADFEVTSKIRTDVRGHYTYVLQGTTERGTKANAVVNKSQWDKFDVPVEERIITKEINRRGKRVKSLRPAPKRKKPIPKGKKKVYNEEIENWLAEHYGIDVNELEG